MMWVLFALLSAFFAAVTSILAKIGIEGINSNLATAIRTVVVLIMAWGIVFVTGTQSQISDISRKSWIFLILSGLATGLSWLFYYKALQMGEDHAADGHRWHFDNGGHFCDDPIACGKRGCCKMLICSDNPFRDIVVLGLDAPETTFFMNRGG